MAPRSLWTGAVSFGLVNVPVTLRSATRDLQPHFHLVDEKTKTRIEIRRYCSKEDKPVEWDEVAHGHEIDGDCVMVTDDELSALEPRKTRTIDIEAFVDLAEIDPVYYDHAYFVVPAGGEGAARAYRLLAQVMEKAGEAALGRFVLRTREYLAALRVRDGVITLSTLLFADELRPASALGDARPKKTRPAKRRSTRRSSSSRRSAATSTPPATRTATASRSRSSSRPSARARRSRRPRNRRRRPPRAT
jgi:DNA end-binding protein Ku